MPAINESNLKKQIKSGTFKNLYFLYGEEKFLIHNYTEKILKAVLNDNDNTFNFQVFNGGELNVDSFFDFASAIPFMSRFKCIKIVDLDLTKFPESELKKFKLAVSRIPESTVVVISQTNINVNTRETPKWTSFLKHINKYADICEFKRLTNLQISKILVSWASEYDVHLNENVALSIIDHCGTDLLNLKNETNKLFSFVDRDNTVTQDAINRLLIKDIYANVFSISKHIFNRDLDKALKELDILLYKKEEPTMILSVLASSYVDMYRVRAATESFEKPFRLTEIFDDYKGKAFRIDIAERNCRKFSSIGIKKCLDILIKTDLKLKTYKVDKKVALQTMIIKLLKVS